MEVHNRSFFTSVSVAHILTSLCYSFILLVPTITEESNFVVHPNRKCNASVVCTSDEMNFTMVCGNDGRTYYTMCEIKRAVCSGEPVEKLSDGPCLEGQECLLAKEFHLKLAAKHGKDVYVPQCNETDGTFLPTQCHHSMGYCWCADRHGRAIKDTATQFSHPDCHHEGRITIKVGRRMIRVSDTEIEEGTEVVANKEPLDTAHTNQSNSSNVSGCSAVDRSNFNEELYKVFEEDFDEGRVKAPEQPKPLIVIRQKFEDFDLNRDSLLNKTEVKFMKKKLRKTMSLLRPCLRRLFRNCDLNCNGTIEADEWIQCLGVNISTSEESFDLLRENSTYYKYETEPSPGATNEAKYINGDAADLEISLRNTSNNFLHAEKRGSRKQMKNDLEEEKSDCRRERARILEQNSREKFSNIYIPSCTGPNDSLYSAKQCHPHQMICWCVKPDGAVIPGTTSNNIQCDSKSHETFEQDTVQPKPVPTNKVKKRVDGSKKLAKPIKKGCVAKKMKKFLRLHLNLMKIDCYSKGNCMGKNVNVALEASIRRFNEIDANKNKEIARNEWKTYRDLLLQSQNFMGVRKCAKQFLKYCDANENKRISKEEWVNCTVKGTALLPLRIVKLMNPFLDVLKYDN